MANSQTSAGDVLILHEDGTVSIGWDLPPDDTESKPARIDATLRRPTSGAWLSFLEEYEAANLWAEGEPAEEGGAKVPRTMVEALKGGPFLKLYRRLLSELAGVEVDTADLPTWLAVGAPMSRISGWWLSSPLSRSDQAAVTRTLSR